MHANNEDQLRPIDSADSNFTPTIMQSYFIIWSNNFTMLFQDNQLLFRLH